MISLGCPKNLVDSEVMLGLAQKAGHQLTRDAADAEVLVVNTCAFIDKAKQESIDAILEMAQHKRDGKASRLVVTGCLAERYRDELRDQIPEIDAVLGTGQVPDIVRAIAVVAGSGPRGQCKGQVAVWLTHGTAARGPSSARITSTGRFEWISSIGLCAKTSFSSREVPIAASLPALTMATPA